MIYGRTLVRLVDFGNARYSATRWRGSTVSSHLNENRPIEALIQTRATRRQPGLKAAR
jgi:hypothetical protein